MRSLSLRKIRSCIALLELVTVQYPLKAIRIQAQWLYIALKPHKICTLQRYLGNSEPTNLTAITLHLKFNTLDWNSLPAYWTLSARLPEENIACHMPRSHKWHLAVFFYSSKRYTYSKSNQCYLCELNALWPLFVKGQVLTKPSSHPIVFIGQTLFRPKWIFCFPLFLLHMWAPRESEWKR